MLNSAGGHDHVHGGAGNDTINASSGNDTANGNADDDSLLGGDGSDRLNGGDGNDTLDGEDNNDNVQGDGGNEYLVASNGSDTMDGGDGADVADYSNRAGALTLTATGSKVVKPGWEDVIANIETFIASEFDDWLFAGPEMVNVQGLGGNDFMASQGLNNYLDGGDGDDSIFGYIGDDTLRGGPGDDQLWGNGVNSDTSADIFVLAAGEGIDTVKDFEEGIDLIGLADGLTFSDLSFNGSNILLGSEILAVLNGVDTTTLTPNDFVTIDPEVAPDPITDGGAGTSGDDAIFGSDEADTLAGGSGNDTLDGNDGDDDLSGGSGNDVLGGGGGGDDRVRAGSGDDTANGGKGDDTVAGGSGDDVLAGAGGEDLVSGDTGDDQISGGSGSDTLVGGAGDDQLFGDETGGEATYALTIDVESESTAYRNTFGWYDTSTGEARILAANVGTSTDPAIDALGRTLFVGLDDLDDLGFFLIPGGYGENGFSGEATTLNLLVFEDAGVWRIKDTDSENVLEGRGAAAYFTEVDKNPDGDDHVKVDGDLLSDGAMTQAWEDLFNLGDHDFNDAVFKLSLQAGGGSAADDSLVGGSGDDDLFGNGGADTLDGGDGDDHLRGGLGDDTLTGGEGDDIFVLTWGEGTDTITDFEVGADRIGLADGLTFEALSLVGFDIVLGAEKLAILNGVDTATLGEFDFVIV